MGTEPVPKFVKKKPAASSIKDIFVTVLKFLLNLTYHFLQTKTKKFGQGDISESDSERDVRQSVGVTYKSSRTGVSHFHFTFISFCFFLGTKCTKYYRELFFHVNYDKRK